MVQKIITAVTVFIIVFLGAVYFFGSRATENTIKDIIAEQKILEGKISAADINASWNGSVYLNDVKWTSDTASYSADIESVELKFNIFDAILHGASENSITEITLHKPHFSFAFDDDYSRAPIGDVLKEKLQLPAAAHYSGILSVIDGQSDIKLAGREYALTKINGELNFRKDTLKTGNFNGMYADALISCNFKTDADHSELIFTGSGLSAESLFSTADKNTALKITDGKMDLSANFSFGKSEEQLSLQGQLNNIAGSIFSMPVNKISGSFHGDLSELTVTKLDMYVAEQPVSAAGKIILPETFAEQPQYDIEFNSGHFALSALSSGINVTDGVTVKGRLSGNMYNPVLEGNFGIAVLDFAPLKIKEMHGSFLYFANQLNIANAVGHVEDGLVKADGKLDLESGSFKFDLLAENISAGLLTENEVKGKSSFEAVVMGSNEPESAVALGRFAIIDGKYKKIPFSKITGTARYDKSGYRFSDTELHTFMGSIPLDLFILDNGKLRFSD